MSALIVCRKGMKFSWQTRIIFYFSIVFLMAKKHRRSKDMSRPREFLCPQRKADLHQFLSASLTFRTFLPILAFY